jgi:hypothetical protein
VQIFPPLGRAPDPRAIESPRVDIDPRRQQELLVEPAQRSEKAVQLRSHNPTAIRNPRFLHEAGRLGHRAQRDFGFGDHPEHQLQHFHQHRRGRKVQVTVAVSLEPARSSR